MGISKQFDPAIEPLGEPTNDVRDVCKDFIMSDDQLRCVMDKLFEEICKGLNINKKSKSSVKCWNTYVQDFPTMTVPILDDSPLSVSPCHNFQRGEFLALDLGGTNFRVLMITLDGEKFDMKSKIYAMSPRLLTGTGEALFSYIAECLAKFMKENKVDKKVLPLGFTFSFPMEQKGLREAILVRWTKGFNCSGVVGEDVVELFECAIKKRNDIKDMRVTAILNDTVGTLMSCAWKNQNTRIGTILGTGTNTCYVEKIENVGGFEGIEGDDSKPEVIINTEWGAFGDHGELNFLLTPYDKEVDATSINKGTQIFEKMISGMYLGELVRLVLVKLASDNIIFNGKLSPPMNTCDAFKTSFISEIESDKKGCYIQCRKVLKDMRMEDVTDQDCANVRFVCECISRRAAHLASAGLATVLNRMAEPSVTIGVDGSLYKFHPHFHNLMEEKIAQLVDPCIESFTLMLSEDGSGRGAALVAAAAEKAKC